MEAFEAPDAAEATPPANDRGAGERAVWSTRDLIIGTFGAFGLYFIVLVGIVAPVAASYADKSPQVLIASAIAACVWDLSLVALILAIVKRRGGGWRNLGFEPPRVGRWFEIIGMVLIFVSNPVVALLYLRVRKRGGSWRNLSFMVKNRRWFGFAAIVLIGYCASIAFVDSYVVLVNALGLDWLLPGDQIPSESYSNTYVLVALGIAILLMAPFAEEIFFRAFLFGGLRARWRLIWAALVSGFVFSLAHGDPGLILPFTGVGAIFALLYERSNSIYTSIAVHFVFNAVSFTILVATNT